MASKRSGGNRVFESNAAKITPPKYLGTPGTVRRRGSSYQRAYQAELLTFAFSLDRYQDSASVQEVSVPDLAINTT